jgi:hypothetical protein
VTVADKMKGTWFAQWGNWGVRIAWQNETWEATVWRWQRGRTLDKQFQMAKQPGFKSSEAAIKWAWKIMQRDGARIFVLDTPKNFSPASVLPFRPMLETVA